MSQQELEFVNAAAGVIAIILETALFCMLWDTLYCPGRERTTRIAQAVLLLGSVGLEFVPNLPTHGRLLLLCPIIMCYAYIRDRENWKKAIFTMALFYGCRSLSWLVANSIQQLVCGLIYSGLDYEKLGTDGIFRCTAYLIVLFFVLYLLVLFLMLSGVRHVLEPPARMNWHDVSFLSVLNLVGGLFANLVVNISMVELDEEIFILFDEKKEVIWLLPLIAFLLYFGELSAITIFQKYRNLQQEQELHCAERQQVRAMKQRLQEAESFYGSIRKVRHEMKNHLTNLRALVAEEQYFEAERYLAKLDESVGELSCRYATGNAVTDVILSDKSKLAEKADIRFDVQFTYEEADGIDVFDVGVILNNLLDNAITACGNMPAGERFVRLSLRRKKHFLLLEVENSYHGALFSADDGLPQTTKDVRLPEVLMEHGVGLRNVREIAERYFGTMDIKAKDHVFRVTVMMQQKGEKSYENHNTDVK